MEIVTLRSMKPESSSSEILAAIKEVISEELGLETEPKVSSPSGTLDGITIMTAIKVFVEVTELAIVLLRLYQLIETMRQQKALELRVQKKDIPKIYVEVTINNVNITLPENMKKEITINNYINKILEGHKK